MGLKELNGNVNIGLSKDVQETCAILQGPLQAYSSYQGEGAQAYLWQSILEIAKNHMRHLQNGSRKPPKSCLQMKVRVVLGF